MGRVLQDKTAYATGRGVRSQAPGGRQVPRKWNRHRRESLQKKNSNGRTISERAYLGVSTRMFGASGHAGAVVLCE